MFCYYLFNVMLILIVQDEDFLKVIINVLNFWIYLLKMFIFVVLIYLDFDDGMMIRVVEFNYGNKVVLEGVKVLFSRVSYLLVFV